MRPAPAPHPPNDPARARQVELVLQQVDALPTLSPIAARLLDVTSPADADLDEIVSLIESDPALTAKVLGLCRRADRITVDPITTVQRAVVLLGLEAVQSAVLSIAVYEMFQRGPGAPGADEPPVSDGAEYEFDRVGFWRHCIAVGAASELIASRHRRLDVRPDEAFVAGLLHDLGKLVLDLVLPRAYRRVLGLAERRQCSAGAVEREIIGLDHHVAGKRLAEHWGLPHSLQDVMWLNGQPASGLPDLPHRPLIGVVTVASALCRGLHLGWSGDFAAPPPIAALAREHRLDPVAVESVIPDLHAAVVARCRTIGLDNTTTPEVMLQSLMAANRRLGRLNSLVQARAHSGHRQTRVLAAISAFHASWRPGRGVVDTFADVVRSAADLFGAGFYACALQTDPDESWQLCQFSSDGLALRTQVVEPPAGLGPRGRSLAALIEPGRVSVSTLSLLPWLTDYLGDSADIRRVQFLALTAGSGFGPACVLLHDRDITIDHATLSALTGAWASAVTAATQHEGARRLGEQLAGSNRLLAEAQTSLAEAQSLVRLGEMAAGAAHEMNNPLTVISGRSQLLSHTLTDGPAKAAAASIAGAAQHLSDLITSLRLLSDPPRPVLKAVRLDEVVRAAVSRSEERTGIRGQVRVVMPEPAPEACIDRELIASALCEAVTNGLEASSGTMVEVRVDAPLPDGRIQIAVEDKGTGMSAKALQHAFDPFFSDKPAGRQTGLGLSRARRLVDLHDGELTLRSTPGAGTTATLVLPGAPRAAAA